MADSLPLMYSSDMWTHRIFVLACVWLAQVESYGRLLEPPSRGSLWRFGYDAPVDENDDQNDCGGADVRNTHLVHAVFVDA